MCVSVSMYMKYEWIITGQEFFRQSDRQVGMLCGGMQNLESQNNVRRWNEGKNDEGRKKGPGGQESNGEGKRSGQELEE